VGNLLPYFIAIRNGGTEHLQEVVHGNEHVLIARFTDAAFFFRADRERKLADFMPRLKTLTFQEKLGSMYDKNERIGKLIDPLSKLLQTDDNAVTVAHTAAPILKADLATQMVVEMTSLAGIMGREYAFREGYSKPVGDAIFEHNLPRSAGDLLPKTEAGTLLALADKLDSLVGLFGAGLQPTATADPYGLRRAALGIVQIMIERQIDADLRKAISAAASVQPVTVDDATRAKVLDFIAGRLRVWLLEEEKLPFDVVEAVLAEQAHNPYRALLNGRELAKWVSMGDWSKLLDAYARCVRITRKEKPFTLHPDALTPAEAVDLYKATKGIEGELTSESANEFLTAFSVIVPTITKFFDNVLVMDEDQAVRENRLALLQFVSNLAKGRADLSKLSGF
jgi:glycyl-tRNA synthetase